MKKIKNTKLIIALASWGVLITASAISIPFLISQQKNVANQFSFTNNIAPAKMSFNPVSPYEAQVNINNLDNFLNKWLTLEYSPIVNSATRTNTNSNNSSNTKTHNFFVRNGQTSLRIYNLEAGVKYSFRLLFNGLEVPLQSTSALPNNEFYTFSKPSLTATSGPESISIVSSLLNGGFKNHNIVFKYGELGSKEPLQTVAAVIGDNTLNSSLDADPNDFTVQANIVGLKKGTAYIIHLEIDGKSGFFAADPIVVWTKGGQPKTLVTAAHPYTAMATLGGIQDFIVSNDTNTSFLVKYWKESETIEQAQSKAITLGGDEEVVYQITGLEPDTTYKYRLFRVEASTGQTTELELEQSFRTLIAPKVVEKANTSSNLSLPVWKSSKRAIIYFDDFKSTNNEASNIDATNLQVVLIKKPQGNEEIDWKSSANKVSFTDDASEKYVEFNDLEKASTYLVQVFNKNDSQMLNPYLDQALEFSTSSTFQATVTENLDGKAKINLLGLNNVVSNELELVYWIKGDESNKTSKLLTWEGEVSNLEVLLEQLKPGKDYEFMVVPANSKLSSLADSLLTEGKVEFLSPGYISAKSPEIQNGNVKIVLEGINVVPTIKNVDLKIQWRKATEEPTDWEMASDENSFDFKIPTDNSGNEYTINLALSKVAGTNKTLNFGTKYEWRVVKKSETNNVTTNEVKSGDTSFSLNKSVYSYTGDKPDNSVVNFNNSNSWVKWKNLDLDNLLTWNEGQAASVLVSVSGAKLTTQKQWSDFYEYLAYSSESEQEKFKDLFSKAVATLTPTPTSLNSNGRWKIIPFNQGDNWTDNSDSVTSPWFARGKQGVAIGGYAANFNPTDAPIKPSDFMTSSAKFINFAAIKTAIQYRLQLTQQKWGIAKDNMFATNLGNANKATTYASSITTAKEINGLYNLSTSDLFGDYTLSIEENTDSETNIFANDKEGRVYFKVKATKTTNGNSEEIFFWQYIDGFKILDTSTAPSSADYTITRRIDSLDTALVISQMYKAASDEEAKKAVILKHFDIKVNSPAHDYDITNVSFDGSNVNQLKITLKLKPKAIKVGTFSNHAATETLSLNESTHEFTVEVPRVIQTVSQLNLGFTSNAITTGQVGSITDINSINNNQFRAGVLLKVPYFELNAIFRDALQSKTVLNDTTSYNALVTKIQTLLNTGLGMNTSTMINRYVYLRAGLNEPFVGISNVIGGQFNLENDSNNQQMQYWISDIALANNNDAGRKQMAESFINKYGVLTPVVENAIKRS